MLIGEVVPTMLSYLKNNPEEKGSYDHILVDEYQDLNRAEQELIEHLSAQGAQLVIGDDDQSIYGFKFAHPEGVVEYSAHHEQTLSLESQSCRRCPPLVVEMANTLMSHQVARHAERVLICADPERPEDVAIVRWPTTGAEAEGLGHFIQQYLLAHPELAPGAVLVLAPRRQLAYGLRDALAARGLQSRSYFHEEELDELPAQRALTLLRLMVNPHDRVSVRWWLGQGTPSFRPGPTEGCEPTARRAGTNRVKRWSL